MGFLPNAVVNYMARLGHYYADNRFMSIDELAHLFDVKNLNTSPARYDEVQLLHWQRQAVLGLTENEFFAWAAEAKSIVPENKKSLFCQLAKETTNFPAEVLVAANLFFTAPEALTEETQKIIQEAGAEFFRKSIEAIDLFGIDFNAIKKYLSEQLGVQGKALFMPFRIALTGRLHGPDLGKILELLGAKEAKRRLTC
jgi:glutamyl/glutaminyl-tRNA synthetase